ncbi:hypothetical protein [Segetibacter aerophilus]|uniref:Uncharacterized protein n=1 Tax=Segetibacter aerophilus TaxID=670293 RepID=A0A512BC33_9BACT|nr:hypothetical protein [Segetibacter aerophilus]GEO09526.1 hypothetical protein SAE01_20220 [Segetibacter aerophilus]
MEKTSSFAKIVYLLALIATIIGFRAFSQKPETNPNRKEQATKDNDTTKSSKRFRYEDNLNSDRLDMELNQLNMNLEQLNERLKNIDFSKAQRQIDQAMKKIDAEKISAEVNRSLKSIDWNRMNREIDESIAKVDKVKMMEVRREMEKMKEKFQNQKMDFKFDMPDIDTKKIRLNTEKAMKEARKSMEKARGSMEKAREEMKSLRDFTNALQSEGLIDKSKPYKIEVKDGELYINGNKQSKEVNDKYRKYFKKENFTINMNRDEGIRI